MNTQATAAPEAEQKPAPVTRLVSVEVTLFFRIPVDQANEDGYACDAVNETLRERQNQFNPISDLMDYHVGETRVLKLDLPEAEKAAYEYEEGDASSVVFVEEL